MIFPRFDLLWATPEWEQKVVVLVLRGEVASCGILCGIGRTTTGATSACVSKDFLPSLFLDAVTLFTRRLLSFTKNTDWQQWNGSISTALANVTVGRLLCGNSAKSLP